MNVRTPITLSIVAMIMATFYFVVQRDVFNFGFRAPTTGEFVVDDDAPQPVFPDVAGQVDTITDVTITVGEESVSLSRLDERGSEWWQTEPVRFALNIDDISGLITGILDLRYTQTVDAGEVSRDEAGLAPPLATIRISGTLNDKPIEFDLSLGRSAGIGRAYAATSDRDEIFVIPDRLKRQLVDSGLTPRIQRLRQRSILAIPAGRIRGVDLAYEDDRTALEKNDGEWRVIAPTPGRANPRSVAELISMLNAAQIRAFMDGEKSDAASFGLDNPIATIGLIIAELEDTTDDNEETLRFRTEPFKLTIGEELNVGDQREYYARTDDSDAVFTLSAAVVEQMFLRPTDLRDPRLTPANPRDIQSVTIAWPDQGQVAFEKSDDTWKAAPSQPVAIDPDRAARAVQVLVGTGSRTFREDTRVGARLADVTLVVQHRDEPEKLSLFALPAEEGQLAVIRNDEKVARIVSRSQLNAVLASPLAFRSKNVLSPAAADLQSITIERQSPFPARYVLTRGANNVWKLPDGSSNPESIRNLVDAITPLRAESWIAKDVEDTPIDGATLTMVTKSGEMQTVRFDLENDIAKVDGGELRFKPAPLLESALLAEFRDPVVIDLGVRDIASVNIAGITINRDRIGRYSRPDGLPVPERKTATMFNAISGLRVEHFIDPAKRPTKTPDYTIDVESSDAEKFKIQIWLPNSWQDGPAIAQVNDGLPFTMIRDVVRRLTAPLINPARGPVPGGVGR